MGDVGGDSDEKTSDGRTRTITLSPFYLAQTETTVGQYRAHLLRLAGSAFRAILSGCGPDQERKLLEAFPGETVDRLEARANGLTTSWQCQTAEIFKVERILPDIDENYLSNDHPVVGLPFDDRQSYCQYYGGDLPSAAQIERASKGPSGRASFGTPLEDANIVGYGTPYTTEPVCGMNGERKNRFGVCDLAGNALETTGDAYDRKFYDRMPSTNPRNPVRDPLSQQIEYRGGSWALNDWYARSSFRQKDTAAARTIGFRCAFPMEPLPKKPLPKRP